MSKDYYLVLGITSEATRDDIKEAYRKLAKEYHPDHYGKNNSPFLAIQEAYSVLSDPIKRQSHDLKVLGQKRNLTPRYGERIRFGPKGCVEPLIPEQGTPMDLRTASQARPYRSHRPSFDEMFDRIISNFRQAPRLGSDHPEDHNIVITLTPEQAFRGGQIKVVLPVEQTCPFCSGQGWIGGYECWRCNGEDILSGEYPIMINFPPSTSHNHVVRIPLDHYGIKNFYLTVHFRISEIL